MLGKFDPDDVPVIREALEDTAKEAMRAGEIVRRLRNFVARGEVEKTIEDLPALINEAAMLGLMDAREKKCQAPLRPRPVRTARARRQTADSQGPYQLCPHRIPRDALLSGARKSTRLTSSNKCAHRMQTSACKNKQKTTINTIN